MGHVPDAVFPVRMDLGRVGTQLDCIAAMLAAQCIGRGNTDNCTILICDKGHTLYLYSAILKQIVQLRHHTPPSPLSRRAHPLFRNRHALAALAVHSSPGVRLPLRKHPLGRVEIMGCRNWAWREGCLGIVRSGVAVLLVVEIPEATPTRRTQGLFDRGSS